MLCHAIFLGSENLCLWILVQILMLQTTILYLLFHTWICYCRRAIIDLTFSIFLDNYFFHKSFVCVMIWLPCSFSFINTFKCPSLNGLGVSCGVRCSFINYHHWDFVLQSSDQKFQGNFYFFLVSNTINET